MSDWFVSECDVMKHSEYGTKTLEKILHDLGMDVHLGYQTDDRERITGSGEDFYGNSHRSALTGEICSGVRYIGEARQDGKWKRFMDRFLDLPLK